MCYKNYDCVRNEYISDLKKSRSLFFKEQWLIRLIPYCSICKNYTYWKHDKCGYPHPPRAYGSFADGFFCYHSNDIVKYKENHRGDKRKAESAFANYGAKRSSDKEKYNACKAQRKFAMPFNIMSVDIDSLCIVAFGI